MGHFAIDWALGFNGSALGTKGNQSLTDSGAFGGGPRLCPGRFLASEAAQRLLAAVLAKDGFSWKLKQGQDLRQQYIPGLFPADGLIVDIS